MVEQERERVGGGDASPVLLECCMSDYIWSYSQSGGLNILSIRSFILNFILNVYHVSAHRQTQISVN